MTSRTLQRYDLTLGSEWARFGAPFTAPPPPPSPPDPPSDPTPPGGALGSHFTFTDLVWGDPSAAVANGAAIMAQLKARPGIGRIPGAPLPLWLALTVNPTNTGYASCLRIPDSDGAVHGIVGDGIGKTVLQLSATGTRAGVNDLVTNEHVGGGGLGGCWLGALTFDAKALDQAATAYNHGVAWRRTTNCHERDVEVRDCRGAGGGASTEMFHHEAFRSDHCTFKGTGAVSTVGLDGPTSSGHSANYSDSIVWEDTYSSGMGKLMGLTAYRSTNLRITRARTTGNRAQGINLEYSDLILVEQSTSTDNKGTGILNNRSKRMTVLACDTERNGTAGWGGREAGLTAMTDATDTTTPTLTAKVVDMQVIGLTDKGNVKGVVLLSASGYPIQPQVYIDASSVITGNTSANGTQGANTVPPARITYTTVPVPAWPA